MKNEKYIKNRKYKGKITKRFAIHMALFSQIESQITKNKLKYKIH